MESARQYRMKSDSLGDDHPDQKKLREQVAKLVEQAFQIRQELHSQELKQLQERIAKVQQSLAKRSENRAAIIENRTNELLDEDLEWNVTTVPSGVYAAPPVIPRTITRPDGSNATVYEAPLLPSPVLVSPPLNVPQSQVLSSPTFVPQIALPSGADHRRTFVDATTVLQQAEAEIARLRASLKSEDLEKSLNYEAAVRRADSAKRSLELLQRELEAQKKLLELDLQAAENELKVASDEFEQKSDLQKRGVASNEEVLRAQASVDHAKIRVSRAKILLNLHQETTQSKSVPAQGNKQPTVSRP
jgi:hypothetical protein